MMKLFYIALLLLAKYGFLEIQATLTRPAKLCQRLRIPFLVADCTNERNVGSSCRLSCRGNLYLVGGIRTIQCRPTGLWKPDLRRVRCTPINPPPLPTCPRHSLSYKSRCSNSINVGSVCDLSCASDQLLLGKVSQVTCLSNGRWSADLSNTRCIPIDPRCPAVPSGVFCFRAAFCDIPCTEGRICCPSPCGTSCLDIPPEVDPRCPALPPHNVVCKRRDRCNRPCSRGEVCCATPCGETCTDVTPDVDPRCPPRRLEAILCPALPPRPPPSCPICRDDQECCPINCFGFTCTQFPPACDPRQPQADCIGSSCTGGGCPAFPDAVCFESSCGGCYPAFTDSEVGVIPSFACELGSNWPSCLAATTCSAITDPNCNGGCERHPYLSCVQDCDCNVVYIDPSNGREIDQNECEPVVDPRCPPVPDGIVCAIAEFCDLPCSGDEICCPSPCGTTCTDVTPVVDPRCPPRRLDFCPAFPPRPPPSCPICRDDQGCCPINCFGFTCTQFPPDCHPGQPQARCGRPPCLGARCPAFPDAVCFESSCGGCFPAFTDGEVGVIPSFACELGSNWPSCLAATTCSVITDPNCNGGCERHPYLSCVQDCECNVVYIDPSNGREIDQNECETVVDPRCPPVPVGIKCVRAEFCDLPCSGNEICCPSPCGTTCTDVTQVTDPACPNTPPVQCPPPTGPFPQCPPQCPSGQICCDHPCAGTSCIPRPVVDPRCPPVPIGVVCAKADFCVTPCSGDEICCPTACGETCTDVSPQVDERCPPRRLEGIFCPEVVPSSFPTCPSCPEDQACCPINCFDYTCTQFPPACDPRQPQADCFRPSCTGGGCPAFPNAVCFESSCGGCYPAFTDSEVGVIPRFACELGSNWPSCLAATTCLPIVDPSCFGRCERHPYLRCVQDCNCNVVFIDPSNGREIDQSECERETDPDCPPLPAVRCAAPQGLLPRCPSECPSGEICCPVACGGTVCKRRPVSFCPQLTPQDGSSSLRFTCSSNIYRTGTTCDIGCRSSRYRLTGIKQTRCSSSGRWVPSVESTQCIITPLCFGRRVTCIADPCQGVSCPALPGAVCVQNNCNSCGFDFYLNGSRIPKRSCIQRGPCLLPTNHRYSCVFCPRTAVCHRRPDAICRPDCLCIPRFYDPKTFEKLNCIPVTIG